MHDLYCPTNKPDNYEHHPSMRFGQVHSLSLLFQTTQKIEALHIYTGQNIKPQTHGEREANSDKSSAQNNVTYFYNLALLITEKLRH